MAEEPIACLNLDGIPSAFPRKDGVPFFWFDPQGTWRMSEGSRLHDIEERCVSLHEAFKRAIMKGVDHNQLVYKIPGFAHDAGHSAEAKVSRQQFEKLLTLTKDIPELNRFLYLYDCQHLVASIQECAKEVEQILGEFYLTFNREPFFYPPLKHEDGIRYSSSPVTTKLSSYLGFLFIRMHSLLDYTVKVAFEAEHLRQDFSRYPKLSCGSLQYGDRKRVGFNDEGGTVFEACEFMTMIETLRNHVIHDGLFDDMPKAYELIKGGIAVEKFVLMPDMTAGRFDRFVNRNLFFGADDKINMRLPALIAEFQARLLATLEQVLEPLRKLA